MASTAPRFTQEAGSRSLAFAGVGMVCMFFLVGCGDDEENDAKELNVYTADKGQVVMRYLDLVEGKGPQLKSGDEVEVHYTGWLASSGKKLATVARPAN